MGRIAIGPPSPLTVTGLPGSSRCSVTIGWVFACPEATGSPWTGSNSRSGRATTLTWAHPGRRRPGRRRAIKSARKSSMPWVWSACSWVKSTPSSQSTSASRSCSRRSGEVSTSTRVTPAPLPPFHQERRPPPAVLGIAGIARPQPSARTRNATRGAAAEDRELHGHAPLAVKLAQMRRCVCAGSRPGTLRNRRKKFSVVCRAISSSRYRPRVGQASWPSRPRKPARCACRDSAGAEVRRVGLDQNAIRGQASRDGAQVIGFLEGQDPGERDKETERDRTPRKIAAAGEAMQHGGEGALPVSSSRIRAMSSSASRE